MKTYEDAIFRNIELTTELIKYQKLLEQSTTEKSIQRYKNRITAIKECIKINHEIILARSNEMMSFYDN